jgi:hypothetical protein
MKPLYKQIEERFRNEVEMPDLEMKKKTLEEIRNFYKPIASKELSNHSRKYQIDKA